MKLVADHRSHMNLCKLVSAKQSTSKRVCIKNVRNLQASVLGGQTPCLVSTKTWQVSLRNSHGSPQGGARVTGQLRSQVQGGYFCQTWNPVSLKDSGLSSAHRHSAILVIGGFSTWSMTGHQGRRKEG